MKYFSDESRIDIEGTILYYIFTYDHRDCFKRVLLSGVDNENYFKNKYRRLSFKICKMMHDEKIIITVKSFFAYVLKTGKLSAEDRHGLTVVSSDYLMFQSYDNLDFFLMVFKEHLINDYWIYTSKRITNEDSEDVIDFSFKIKNGFDEMWEKFTVNMQKIISDEKSLKEEAILQRERMFSRISNSVKFDLEKFDEFTGGLENGELYYIGARPSMGKTSFAVALAKRALKLGKKIQFFTLEMSRKQIINKFISDDLNIDYKDLKRGRIDSDTFEKVLELYDYYENHDSLFIEPLLTRKLSDFKRRLDAVSSDLVIVDYLQLMILDNTLGKKSQNREQEVSMISTSFKGFAKIFNRPFLALCQLSRSVENRPGNIPQMSDLRESGSLEQDADVIMFLYREAYYLTQKSIYVPEEQQGNIKLIIAKGREIGTGNFEFNLDFRKNTVEEGFK